MSARLTILCALLAGAGGAAAANALAEPQDLVDFPSSPPVCRKLGKPVMPVADRPTAAQRVALKGCGSEKLYYGEGVKIDYAKARLCAAIEAERGGEYQGFGGQVILMQVYANGLGVKRNLDLAIAYSCAIDGAPAENAIRMDQLQDARRKPVRIDICDSTTSGLLAGFCAARESRIAAVGRDAGLARLVASFPPAGRIAYPAMRKAFDAFVEASAYKETDTSGTMRGVYIIGARDKLIGQFITDLKRLRDGKWPAGSAADAVAADARLNTTYGALLTWVDSKDNLTTVKSTDVRETQRSWLTFRDAYVRFAAVAAPGVSRDAVLTRLTKLRLAQFDQIRDGGIE